MPNRITHREATPPRKRAPRAVAAGASTIENVEPTPAPAAAPDQAEVARLAYSYWEARGCRDGSAEEDWFRAEEELRGRRAVPDI